MRCRAVSTVMLVCLIVGLAGGRQPQAGVVALPPINPAQARLDGVLGGLDGPGLAITYAEAEGTLWAACEHQTLCSWGPDAVLGFRSAETPAYQISAHDGPLVALTAAGHHVASAGSDGKIILWNLPSATVLHTLNSGTLVRALVFSTDAKSLVSVGDDGAVQVWDTSTGKAGPKWPASGDWLLTVALSPDGKTVATGGLDGKLRLWEFGSGKKLIEVLAQVPAPPNQPVNSPAAIASLAFAPDGKSIMAGGQDGLIYHFGMDGKLIRTMTGHGSTVTGLAFHPTGTLLVSSSKDRTVRLWTPANGQPVKILEGHTAWVMGVTFAAHGTRLASVSADHSVRIWDISEPAKK